MFSREDYMIGWICDTTSTLAAATAILDDTHPDLPIRSTDYNGYTLGRISGHNIVVVVMPSGQYGTAAAAILAAQMMHSFESIRFILSLGIAGAVPRNGVRLGDIVVSYPTNVFGGVVQYDIGRSLVDGSFERTGSLSKPPQAILTAVAKLRAIHLIKRSKIPTFLSEMTARYPRLATKFIHPGQHQDRLYQAGYKHVGESTCDDCEESELVLRCPRLTNDPKVYYGVIASGNSLIKHSGTRYRLAKEMGVLCFDLEAAGLMDHFPCLAIRGISDYADSHKYKRWQPYAAATAAAYAKELLSVLPVNEGTGIPPTVSTTSSQAVQEPGRMIPMTQPDVETPDVAITTARVYSREDYTIGWICALPLEMAAAMALLDTIHPDLPVHPIDHNTYALGKIGEHNIVVACLPAGVYGTTSSAVAAAQMMNSFESVRFGLLVGIGSGIPWQGADIRLGDVVVSRPSGGYAGVVQFNRGKLVGDGAFLPTNMLNHPPFILLQSLTRLEIEHERKDENNISKTSSEMLERYPAMRDEQFVYQGEEHDMLYEAAYSHRSGKSSCRDCDQRYVIHRPARDTSPRIHYGTIGSANRVVKDATTRDQLRNEFGIICVEMEAAGLMDNFPCLVIRGICDYADSRKNKRWQPYAAATAAVYAKELLAILPSSQTIATVRAVQAVQQRHD